MTRTGSWKLSSSRGRRWSCHGLRYSCGTILQHRHLSITSHHFRRTDSLLLGCSTGRRMKCSRCVCLVPNQAARVTSWHARPKPTSTPSGRCLMLTGTTTWHRNTSSAPPAEEDTSVGVTSSWSSLIWDTKRYFQPLSLIGKLMCAYLKNRYRKTSDRSPRLLPVHFTFTPGLYPGPSL